MPVEQDKKKNNFIKQDAPWEIDEHLMNIDHANHQQMLSDYAYLQHHQHQYQSEGPENGGQMYRPKQSDLYYENDSYNNNNNVKFNSSMVAPPMRRYSTGTRVQPSQPHRIPNGHLDEQNSMRYSDTDSLSSIPPPPPKQHARPFRQQSSPDMDLYSTRSHRNDYSDSSTYWNSSAYPNHEVTMGFSSVDTSSEYSVTSGSVPDGYATIGRTKKGEMSKELRDVSLRKNSDSGVLSSYRSQGNGLHLINRPEFLAHSLALSNSTTDVKISGKSRRRNNEEGRMTNNSSSSSSSNAAVIGRQDKQKLSHTINALPQHDIQVQQDRSAYLEQSTPLSQTQPLPVSHTVHSAPATPLGETFPAFIRQNSNNSRSSTPTSSNGGDAAPPPRKQSLSNKSPLHTISESIKSKVKNPKLGRSSSTPNILEDLENIDDDIDKDDYGFLSYRSFRTKNHPFKDQSSSSSASAMHKSTDEQAQSRTFSRKWKKSKLTQTKSVPTSSWKPQVSEIPLPRSRDLFAKQETKIH